MIPVGLRNRVLWILGILALVGAGAWFGVFSLSGGSVRTSPASVREELRRLAEFHTASFMMEKVIQAGSAGSGIREFLFGDRILLIAVGEVTAGFDLSSLSDTAIRRENGVLIVTLPAPQILGVSLDEQATQVFDRKKGILASGDIHLESLARQEAETVMRQTACDRGILRVAREEGIARIEGLLLKLGTPGTVEAPEGACN
jgi:hypothetical protein